MTVRPGPRNLITDVDGVLVGNAEWPSAVSGVTVVIFEPEAIASIDVRGGAPASRDTELLRPENRVEHVDAIVLSGGSVYGLGAGNGVVKWLRARGRGFAVPPFRMPIVPGAGIFDLTAGGGHEIMDGVPYPDLGAQAAAAAQAEFELGNVGAGLGATAGSLKGGLGSASVQRDDGLRVGALAVVNSVGATVMGDDGAFWAWPFEVDGEFGGRRPDTSRADRGLSPAGPLADATLGANTTLAIVATNATLSKSTAKRVATMAHDGMAQAIRPVHTPFDGDTIFSVATGTWTTDMTPVTVSEIGMLAADCTARAIARAVYAAEDIGDIRCYRSVYGTPAT